MRETLSYYVAKGRAEPLGLTRQEHGDWIFTGERENFDRLRTLPEEGILEFGGEQIDVAFFRKHYLPKMVYEKPSEEIPEREKDPPF